MTTLTKFTKTVINTDHLVKLFDQHYPYNGVELIKLTKDDYTILVVLLDQDWIKSGIYTTFNKCETIQDLKQVEEFDFDSILKRQYLIDAIAYCED